MPHFQKKYRLSFADQALQVFQCRPGNYAYGRFLATSAAGPKQYPQMRGDRKGACTRITLAQISGVRPNLRIESRVAARSRTGVSLVLQSGPSLR